MNNLDNNWYREASFADFVEKEKAALAKEPPNSSPSTRYKRPLSTTEQSDRRIRTIQNDIQRDEIKIAFLKKKIIGFFRSYIPTTYIAQYCKIKNTHLVKTMLQKELSPEEYQAIELGIKEISQANFRMFSFSVGKRVKDLWRINHFYSEEIIQMFFYDGMSIEEIAKLKHFDIDAINDFVSESITKNPALANTRAKSKMSPQTSVAKENEVQYAATKNWYRLD